LGFDKLVQVLDRLRLQIGRISRDQFLGRCVLSKVKAYILENSLHQRDSNLSLLDKVVFSILDLEAGVLLLRGIRILKPTITTSQK
jgi:hypothetical protein